MRVVLNDSGRMACSVRSWRDGAVQFDEPVAVRFKSGAHGIPRINGDFSRAVSHDFPDPQLFILRRHGIRDTHSGDALACLEFADPEAFAEAVAGRSSEVQPSSQHGIRPRMD